MRHINNLSIFTPPSTLELAIHNRMFRFEGEADVAPVTPPAVPPAFDMSAFGDKLSATVAESLQKFVTQKNEGDPNQALAQLWQDNYDLRHKLKTATEALPADGSVIMSAEDVTAWDAYKELGDLEALTGIIAERDELKQQVATATRNDLLRNVADAAGYKASVLSDRDLAAGGLEYEIREVDGENGKASVPHVKQNDTWVPLADYAQSEWSDYLPALATTPAEPPKTGVRVPEMGTGGGDGSTPNVVDSFITKMNDSAQAAVNPLAKN